MNESQNNERKFITFEYKELSVRNTVETVYTDAYPRFGWKLDGISSGITHVNLKYKRDRRIENKTELSRLQREFESHAKEIAKLESSKEIVPSTVAYGIGLVGTAFMAGAMFSYLAQRIPLCIILAIPAFIGWIIPYFAFRKIKQSKQEQSVPLIDQQYDAIYEICEKADQIHTV